MPNAVRDLLFLAPGSCAGSTPQPPKPPSTCLIPVLPSYWENSEIWNMDLQPSDILFIAIVLWLASRIYRVGILMYGKKPNLPEILRWLKYS